MRLGRGAALALIAVGLAFAVAGVVAVLLVSDGDEQSDRKPAAGANPMSGPRLTPNPRPREETAAATERRARRIIDGDPVLAPLLKNNRYELREVAPRVNGERQIGLLAMIDPSEPLRGTAVLPYVCGGELGQGGGRILWSLIGARRLDVLLEFAERRAIQVTPTTRSIGARLPPTVRRLDTLPGSRRCPPTEH
jgi:hypothetical protein